MGVLDAQWTLADIYRTGQRQLRPEGSSLQPEGGSLRLVVPRYGFDCINSSLLNEGHLSHQCCYIKVVLGFGASDS